MFYICTLLHRAEGGIEPDSRNIHWLVEMDERIIVVHPPMVTHSDEIQRDSQMLPLLMSNPLSRA